MRVYVIAVVVLHTTAAIGLLINSHNGITPEPRTAFTLLADLAIYVAVAASGIVLLLKEPA